MELDAVEMDVGKRPRASTEEAGRRWEPARAGGGAECGVRGSPRALPWPFSPLRHVMGFQEEGCVSR